MRRLVTVAFLAAVTAGAASDDPPDREYFDFIRVADEFNRKFLGCPPEGFPPEIQCNPALGVFDAKLWKDVKARGRKRFR